MQSWPAPAKLNLFLNIVGQRSDGYHLLQTVFQLLDYGDEIFFDLRDDGVIERKTNLSNVPEQQDLMVRAANLLQQTTGTSSGVSISINKRLPMGGGLGGGSSDAATTLVALNALWGLNLSLADLIAIALRLGADVPVFVMGFTAWGEGIGQDLTPLKLPQLWYLIIVPPCQVSTKEIFSAGELTRNAKPITITDFLSGQVNHNVCLPVVRSRYPAVSQALDWLSTYGQPQMSGTGCSVFTAFESKVEAQIALSALPYHWKGFIAQGVNISPLQTKLSSVQLA